MSVRAVRLAGVGAAVVLLAGIGVAFAATPDTYAPPCTANTDACRQQRIVALENHYKGHSHPTPTPTPTPSATPTPTPSPTPSPSSTSPTPTATPTGFPDASNTGVPTGTTLTAYTGPMTITTAGTVIDGKQINGQLTVNAANVTVRNSRVTSTGYYGILNYGSNLLIEDSTFNGATGTASIAVEAGTVTARRVNVSGGEDGVRLASNCTLEASYIHDLGSASGGHYDAVTADGFTGVKITGNTILNQHDQTAAVWIGDPRYAPSGVELRGNLIGGGGWTIYAGPGSSVVADNRFSTRFFPQSGYWGVVAYWTSGSGIWSGNTWADGPNAGQPVTP